MLTEIFQEVIKELSRLCKAEKGSSFSISYREDWAHFKEEPTKLIPTWRFRIRRADETEHIKAGANPKELLEELADDIVSRDQQGDEIMDSFIQWLDLPVNGGDSIKNVIALSETAETISSGRSMEFLSEKGAGVAEKVSCVCGSLDAIMDAIEEESAKIESREKRASIAAFSGKMRSYIKALNGIAEGGSIPKMKIGLWACGVTVRDAVRRLQEAMEN